jgi:nitrite reductase/ring-hydroxylating ferredoxin subunit
MTRSVNTETEHEQRYDDEEEGVISLAVGSPDDFAQGRMRIVALSGEAIMPADREIGVLLTDDGAWYAVRNLCPHRGGAVCRGRVTGTMLPTDPGAVEYALDGKILVCPWHQHEFDIESGDCLFIDDHSRLIKYPVEVVDGEVRVHVTTFGPAAATVSVELLPEVVHADPASPGAVAGAYE